MLDLVAWDRDPVLEPPIVEGVPALRASLHVSRVDSPVCCLAERGTPLESAACASPARLRGCACPEDKSAHLHFASPHADEPGIALVYRGACLI